MEVVDCVFRLLPSLVLQERQQTNEQVFWAVDWLAHVLKQDVENAHAQAPQFNILECSSLCVLFT